MGAILGFEADIERGLEVLECGSEVTRPNVGRGEAFDDPSLTLEVSDFLVELERELLVGDVQLEVADVLVAVADCQPRHGLFALVAVLRVQFDGLVEEADGFFGWALLDRQHSCRLVQRDRFEVRVAGTSSERNRLPGVRNCRLKVGRLEYVRGKAQQLTCLASDRSGLPRERQRTLVRNTAVRPVSGNVVRKAQAPGSERFEAEIAQSLRDCGSLLVNGDRGLRTLVERHRFAEKSQREGKSTPIVQRAELGDRAIERLVFARRSIIRRGAEIQPDKRLNRVVTRALGQRERLLLLSHCFRAIVQNRPEPRRRIGFARHVMKTAKSVDGLTVSSGRLPEVIEERVRTGEPRDRPDLVRLILVRSEHREGTLVIGQRCPQRVRQALCTKLLRALEYPECRHAAPVVIARSPDGRDADACRSLFRVGFHR